MNEQELMQKLVLSKAIMDKSDSIKNGSIKESVLQEFDVPNAKYNLPKEFLGENSDLSTSNQNISYITKPSKVATIDAIKGSKLPDEIKKLMIEHPISQPQNPLTSGPKLSDELVEKAARLMGRETKPHNIPEKTKEMGKGVSEGSKLDLSKIKKMIKIAVNEALRENGLIVESTEKSNETFQFKVGSHLFEGKVTKIKKLS